MVNENTSLIVLRIFKCNFTFFQTQKRFNCFYGVKRSTNASINHFLKKKDGCRFCVNKKKDGCLLRQQTRRSAVWADLSKQILQVVT